MSSKKTDLDALIDSNTKFITSDFRGTGISISGGEGPLNGTYGGTFSDKYKGFKNVDNFDPLTLVYILQMDIELQV